MELPRNNINRSRAAHPSRRGIAAAEAPESKRRAEKPSHAIIFTEAEPRKRPNLNRSRAPDAFIIPAKPALK